MQGGADSRGPSPVALLPIALVVIGVLVLALVVKGSERGTIVVERIAFSSRTVQSGRVAPSIPFTLTTITQTAADGSLQRSFASNSFVRPAAFQETTAGQSIEVYDARDNTIFETTQAGLERAFKALMRPTGGDAGDSVSSKQVSLRAQLLFSPGRHSVYAQQLRAHQYRVAGRVTIDGRPALRLVQAHPYRLQIQSQGHAYISRTTMFVSPRTDDPIEEQIRTNLPGASDEAIERWTVYRVLPATAANQRLLSLTARHPHAHIVHSARAYLRATTYTSSTTFTSRRTTFTSGG